MLRGKPFHGIHQMSENPFSDAWFAAATGRGTNTRQRIGYVYNLYVRDVYGFNSLASYMFSYLLNWGSLQNKDRHYVRKIVEDAIDETTANAIEEFTGLKVAKSVLGQGEAAGKGISQIYNTWRDMNQQRIPRDQAVPENQAALQKEFLRLMNMNRAWTAFSKSNAGEARRRLGGDNVVILYHQHAGMLEARSYAGKNSENFTVIGYALIEDPAHSEHQAAFLKSLRLQKPAKVPVDMGVEPVLETKKRKCEKLLTDLSQWLKALGDQWLRPATLGLEGTALA
jgi:hypothetical protein